MILLYFIVAPALQNRIGVTFYTWTPDVPDFGPEALAFILMHFSGIFLGYRLKYIRLRRVRRITHLTYHFSFLGVAFAIIVLTALVVIVGYESILSSRIERIDLRRQEVSTYFLFLENVTKFLPAFLLAYFLLDADKSLPRNLRFPIFIALVVLTIVIANPINTSRNISLSAILIVSISYMIITSKLNFLAWFLALSPIYGVVVLGATSIARQGLGAISLERVFVSIQTLEFSSYSLFLDALKVEDFPNDNYLISHFLILIPGSLWEGKAESIGNFVAETFGYTHWNVGLISSFNSYADFGFAGLLLVSVAFGFLVKNLNPLAQTPSFRNRRFVYSVIFTALAPMIFRGDLSTTMISFYSAASAYELTKFLTRFSLRRSVR